MSLPNEEWSTDYPTSQDPDPIGSSGNQDELINESSEGAGDGHNARVSHVHTLRDKLQAVAKEVGDDSNLPAGSLKARTTSLESTASTSDEKDALVGTDGTPSSSNKFVTNSDSRLADSRAPTGSAGGQLGGTYPNPDVRGLRETGGPTELTLGSVSDGQFLKRDGPDIVGAFTVGSSPLTTKGDLFTYDSADTRLPVGSNGFFLMSDSSESLGLKWAVVSGTDTKIPWGEWKSSSTVDFYAKNGEPSSVRIFLQDNSLRTFTGTLNWDNSNNVSDLGWDEASSQAAGDKWIYFYLVPDSGDDSLLTVRASDNNPDTGPTGYTDYKYIWTTYRVSGSLEQVIQVSNFSFRRISRKNQSLSNTSKVSLDISNYVPDTASAGLGQARADRSSNATDVTLYVSGASDWYTQAYAPNSGDSTLTDFEIPIISSTSTGIDYSAGASGGTVLIQWQGWTDGYL